MMVGLSTKMATSMHLMAAYMALMESCSMMLLALMLVSGMLVVQVVSGGACCSG